MSVKDADGHKLSLHPERVAAWLKGDVMPLHAEIGLTNKCNHRCTYCALDWTRTGKDFLDTNILLNCLNNMAQNGVKSIYYAGEGEPTLHPDFADIIKRTKELGMSIALSTNGSQFNYDMAIETLPHLSWIRFSFDTNDVAVYRKLHGVGKGEFSKVIENMYYCPRIKKRYNLDVEIGLQVLLMPETIDSLYSTVLYAKNTNMDNVQIKQPHNHPQSGNHPGETPSNTYDNLKQKLMEYETDNFKIVFRSESMDRLLTPRTYERCHGFDFYALINAKGDIVPCNVFYDKKEFTYGNIYDNSFYDIWMGRRRYDINKEISKSKFSMCGDYFRCRLDVMNRHLQRVRYPERNDEFI